MRHARTAMAAALLVLASTAASANAWVSAHIGDTSVSQNGSGPNFGITGWYVTLDTGESVSKTFDWSVTFYSDHLPATRTWDSGTIFGCMPVYELKCGPDPTGYELIEAYLETSRDGREANPFIDFTGTFTEDFLYNITGQQTASGSFTLTATNTGFGPQSDAIGLLAAVWVDASDQPAPIPEPAGLALTLAGLSLVAAAGRKRRARAAD